MIEIDFFSFSKSRRASERETLIEEFSPTPEQRADFQNYGFNYWDNPEYGVGYGGYSYDGRYGVCAEKMISHYRLNSSSRVLEIGCAKGFILYEFHKRGIQVNGIDLSSYAVENSMEEVKEFIVNGSCEQLPWPDNTFDFVYSKETLPHLSENQLRATLHEIKRVSKTDNIFFEIQVSEDKRGQDLIKSWDETHLTIHDTNWWRNFLSDLDYKGQVNFKILF